ncbi:MAG TPA: NHLP-related RiPP peptide [Rhodanobacteraceae bacterium]|nr:NHLP-related RiPP peptide [Rhodanobacteraceae bacterium]
MIKGNPSPQALHKVLDLLATSHDFREQMLGDPASALKAHGIEVDASQIPAVRKLPPMQEVAAIHKEQFDDPMGKVCISVFLLK